MAINKKVAGAAAATTITGGMTPTVPGTGQTFTVADDTGYPATGAFVVVIDRGEDVEEKILITSRSGVTFTVSARGYDGTAASTHTAGQATCEHALDAVTVQLLIDHVDGVEVNPHDGVLLDAADHDIEARHQFGSGLAFGEPVTPSALTPDIAGAAGTGNNPAREDHVHNVPAAAAISVAAANAEGTAASFARSDHTHAIPNDLITAAMMGANSVGASELANGAVAEAADIVDGIITFAKFASEASVDWSATATFTSPTGNFTLGAGGVAYANYYKIGRIVVYWAHFTLGTGGNISSGGTISLNLPFANTASHRGFAAAKARQAGGLVASGTAAIGVSAALVTNFVTAGVSASWDATSPFNWDVGDGFDTIIVYEAAA